ncbi:E3 ubiquitin-protein ligase MGRN1-like [Clytia hemisphaerica]|uniref:RING-type E3 ubiquitin transferase n=1 Tax=Clytia hemisphaerica TaxID=252671 RepID=A0A7M5X496_9CNID|eukprot:TCONS_00004427-protein
MGNYIPFAMGLNQTDSNGIENLDGSNASTYRYPPKSGAYFANHFVMAGERFDNINSETFLFGENNDLNYLSSKPVPFPYHSPSENEPSHTIRCMVHLRKDSLKMIREKNDVEQGAGEAASDKYHLQFTFDSDIDCAVRIFMMAKEEITDGAAEYLSRKPELVAEPVFFTKGSGQNFNNTEFKITPDDFQPAELSYVAGSQEIPLIIQITSEDPEYPGHSESTIAGIEKLSDGSYTIKFMKQKIMVDGFSMMLQELYGIENKNNANGKIDDEDDVEDDTTECVVCMSSLRDTVMLPCRHLCLCSDCAGHMRNKQSRCPICRANFYALLQIKGVRKNPQGTVSSPEEYEEVTLIEALNGKLNAGQSTDTGSLKRNTSSRSNRSRKSLKARLGSSSKSLRSALSSTPSSPTLEKRSEGEDYSDEKSETHQELDVQVVQIPERAPNPVPPHTVDLPESFSYSPPATPDDQDEEPTIVIDPKTLLRDTSIDEAAPSPTDSSKHQQAEVSLPGTPMDSDQSYELGASGNSSVFFNSSKGSLVIATRAQVTTPSHINLGSHSPPQNHEGPANEEHL